MTRLKFAQAIETVGKETERDGFRLVTGGIFMKSKTKVVSLWMSISGNEHVFSPVFGVSNKDVDRIVNKALRSAIPTFKAVKYGVPLFRMTPERISPGDGRILMARTGEGGYSASEIAGFVEFIRDACYPFLESNYTLPSALDLALR